MREWIVFIVFGLVVGFLARLIHPGKDPGGFIGTALIGIGGSLLGALVGRAIGIYEPGKWAAGFIMSLLGAIALLAIWAAIDRRRHPRPAM